MKRLVLIISALLFLSIFFLIRVQNHQKNAKKTLSTKLGKSIYPI